MSMASVICNIPHTCDILPIAPAAYQQSRPRACGQHVQHQLGYPMIGHGITGPSVADTVTHLKVRAASHGFY
eukprot:1143137-Pelagomonas_calceolata.AAC.2